MDDEIKNLETIQKVKHKFVLPDNMKDCVVLMLKDSFEKGGEFSRDRVAYIIATELRRMGRKFEAAEKTLIQWNQNNTPPLKPSVIRNKVKSAYRKSYTFGCHREPAILEYCIDPEHKGFCKYYTELSSGKKRIGNDRDFIRYNWQNILNGAARDVYYIGLPELEKRRGIKAGDTLYAAQSEISKASGVSSSIIGETLETLREYPLIKYIPGKRHVWRKTASEIKRIIPIPKPSKEVIKTAQARRRKKSHKKNMSLINEGHTILHK